MQEATLEVSVMSDSEDDAAGAALPRQKSIFSTMGRVNHLREKWTARAKLSNASSSSELEASASSNSKKRAASVVTAARPADVTIARAATPTKTTKEAQRVEALATWLQRSGLTVPPARDGDAFDALYESLDEMEAAVKHDLSLLLSSQWSAGAVDTTPPRASSLVDYLVVIGPDVADLVTHSYWLGQENVFEATVVFAHPPHAQFNAESIEQFCFPRGVRADYAAEPEAADEFFVLVLSGGGDQGQNVQYACCLRKQIVITNYGAENPVGVSRMVPVCYAVVVSMPWIPFYHQLLRHLAGRHQEDLWNVKGDQVQGTIVPDTLVQYIDSMMSSMATVELPASDGELRFVYPPNVMFSCSCPRIDIGDPETVTLLLDWSMRHLLSALSVERVVLAVGLLLVEMKVIVVSKQMPLLSAGTVGLAALLYPLSWAGPLISILPPALHEYLEAPVPLLCGVDVLPDQFALTKGTAVLHMDGDIIQLHPDDAAQISALQFPGSEGFCRELRVFSDRVLAVSTSEQSQAVVGNFVARRLRCQLQDLLQLCPRVNPCNAYACMKQEQLSLSETLFLKSFMQSQMYQKYSDDQVSCEPQQKDDTSTGSIRAEETVDSNCQAVPVSASLESSVRDLFMMAITGSCATGGIALPSSDEDDIVANEPDVENQADDGNREGYPREFSLDSTRTSELNSKNGSPVDGPRQEKEQILSQTVVENPPSAKFTQKLDVVQVEQSVIGHVTYESRHGPEEHYARSDVKSHSTPASPEKPLGNQDPLCVDGVQPSATRVVPEGGHPNATRSMPDVLVVLEGAQLPERADTEHLKSMFRILSGLADGDDQNQQAPGNHIRGSSQKEILLRVTQSVAAAVIQGAWRKRWQPRRSISSRALSVVSGRSASDTTIPTSTGEWTAAELHFGTMLSMYTERGKLIDIRVRLGADAKELEWFHGDKLRGSIALTNVHEVKAHDGNILIQTSTQAQFVFVVPPHGASGVMSFFQGLHRLATTDSAGLPSPVTSVGSSEQTSHTLVSSRQDSLLGEPPAQTKDGSSQEQKRTVDDNDARNSSFLTFEDAMRSGILVLKHGRMGRPHPKFLVCDDAIEVLKWVDPTVTNAGFQSPVPASQQPSRVERKGIRFEDITEIRRGKCTRVLQRSTAGRSNADLCFSIVTRTRTLDIEAFSRPDFVLLFDGIQQRMAKQRA